MREGGELAEFPIQSFVKLLVGPENAVLEAFGIPLEAGDRGSQFVTEIGKILSSPVFFLFQCGGKGIDVLGQSTDLANVTL